MFSPLGKIACGVRPSSFSASAAVTSLTVVKTVDACVAAFSIWKRGENVVFLRLGVGIQEGEVVVEVRIIMPARYRPSSVAWVVNSVATGIR